MEAIIEKLLLIEEEQILNTPLDELGLPTRVCRSLRRGRVRTIEDLARTWRDHLPVRNIGEWARREILGALQAWSLSIPSFTTLQDPGDTPFLRDVSLREAAVGRPPRSRGGCAPAPGTPIEALDLSPRTYRLLKRNKIHTLAGIDQGWDKISSIRNVGPKTMDEIHRALEAFHPNLGSGPARNDLADSAVGDETPHEILTKKHVITESGVLVNADLLEAGEPRKSREERWKNIPPKPQDYAPKNTFQAIGEGQNRISGPIETSPIQGRKKILDGSVPIATEWLETSLDLLEKARTSRQVRTINCPICMVLTLSIKFKKHLVEMHPQAFRELQKAAKGSPGRKKKALVL